MEVYQNTREEVLQEITGAIRNNRKGQKTFPLGNTVATLGVL